MRQDALRFRHDTASFRMNQRNFHEISRADALKCIPVRQAGITEEILETGDIQLSFPVRMRPWMERIFHRFSGIGKKPVARKLQLDEMGTAVWQLVDGQRSVRQIVKIFAAKYQLYPGEAEISVTQFLRELGRRGLVGLK